MKLNLETALLKSIITQFPQRFLKLVLQNQLSLLVNRNFLVLKKKKTQKKLTKPNNVYLYCGESLKLNVTL